jgi:hypothetical protein
MNWRYLLFSFVLFTLLGWLLYSHAWNSEFHWDDYHLIRSYSHHELIQVWTGNWDPDDIETAGYRPFSTYFNHVRYMIFGENVYGHRLFLVFLSALMSALFMLIMVELSFSLREGFLAGLLYLVSPSNFYHIAWLTDGIHIFASFFSFLGIFFAIKASRTGRFHWYFLLAHLFGLIGMLSREENTSLYLISIIGPFFFTQMRKPLREHVQSPLLYNTIAGFVVIGVFLLCRKIFIPEALSPFAGTEAVPLIVHNFFKSLLETVNLLALMKNSHLIVSVLMIVGLTGYGIFLGRKENMTGLLFLFFSLVISLLPSSVLYRTNLLLNPTFFAMAILSFSLVRIYRHIPGILKAIGIVAFVFVLGIMARENYLYQESLHPLSLLHANRKGEILFYWKTATIPHVRREKALAELKALGLLENPDPSWVQFNRTIVNRLQDSPPRRPNEGRLFRPLKEPFFR